MPVSVLNGYTGNYILIAGIKEDTSACICYNSRIVKISTQKSVSDKTATYDFGNGTNYLLSYIIIKV